MLDTLRGIRTPAWLTGALRGILEAVLLTALYAALDYFTTAPLPDNWAFLAFVAPLVVRTGEGYIDHIDPLKQRRRAAADRVR